MPTFLPAPVCYNAGMSQHPTDMSWPPQRVMFRMTINITGNGDKSVATVSVGQLVEVLRTLDPEQRITVTDYDLQTSDGE